MERLLVSAKSIRSIKQYLYILAAVVVLAMMGVLGFTIYSNTLHAVAQEKSRLRTLSTIIASNTTYVLERNKEAMELLAKRPAIQAMDSAKCDPVLKEFHDLFPSFANLTTVAGFGVLAFSNVSILQAMGATVAPGVILALIYSAIFARHADE